jgi:hypothetical protein
MPKFIILFFGTHFFEQSHTKPPFPIPFHPHTNHPNPIPTKVCKYLKEIEVNPKTERFHTKKTILGAKALDVYPIYNRLISKNAVDSV